ncbi:bacterioferritin [Castellaniella ginsengisoli]|jgi:bacterioferritin|uniref:Bacterioferritin n=1 Tax=Castellaniella ginsengisoli TaxID=546114 RepID=A0AB39FEY2_9BURK
MQGHPEVIAYLTKQLRGELAARDQYFLHSRRYQDMGLTRLYTRSDHEMQEETQHADSLLQRLLMLEGTPDMRPDAFTPGTDVPGMLRADLELEYEVRASLREGIALCETHGDYVTRDLLLQQLHDTESDHAYWLEKQLGLIEKIGLQNYLQSQT